ncbi:MAG: tRNA (adenosine(37)-N6)-threonylcarbamoyltransferase complex transferase subunit TsaD [Bacteroidetes bacterium]|nr:tRNA (adenosine(37)-N6)-threonylcarbamoyltransferase complex transferase subunit TsaD [Bacteroidota bacterium]
MDSICILAIESSCDETAASVCCDGIILSNSIAIQSVHEQYGGVVPELASRAHMQNIVPVVDIALAEAFKSLSVPERLAKISAIAFTQAPGLIGSLLVGAQFAKSLALALNKPLIAVHHMQAHVLANLIGNDKPDFPFLCLTVSGGHTQIVLAKSPLNLTILGETIDDAAGEAFDKSAKLLGLPYPGGPLIDQYAKIGNPLKFSFAEPQIPNLNFSFSGLKTSVLYFLQKQTPEFILENRNDLCASIQHTIVTILLKKVKKAVAQTGVNQVCLAGGVSANSGLRNGLQAMGIKHGWKTFVPSFEYCTDNAAMIAMNAYYKYQQQDFIALDSHPTARAEW